MNKKLEDLARKIQVSSDPNRMEILCLLFDEDNICVSDLAKKLKLSVATVSYHLQALVKENIISSRREGKMICYKMESTEIVKDFKNFICKHKI